MHSGFASLHDVRGFQFRQALQPQACGLGLAVSELLGLDDLLRFADAAGDDADRVFQRDASDGCS